MDFKRLLLAAMILLLIGPAAFAKSQKKKAVKSSAVAAAEKKAAEKKAKEKAKKKDAKKGETDQAAKGEEVTAEEEEESGNAEDSWQLLEWEDETQRLTLKYEVIIEQRDRRGNFSEILRLTTKDNTPQIKIEPALQPGNYRYSVISYNLFGVAKAQSEWEDFAIYKAYKPRVNGVSVGVNLSSNIYLDYDNDGIITFDGRNLFMPSEGIDDLSFTDYILKTDKGREVEPKAILEHADNDHKIKFQFSMDDLDVGKYQLIATDASGLTNDPDNGNILTVRFKKWMDLNLSAGYVCPIVLFDDTIEKYFGKKVFPLSATARLTFFPFKRKWGNLGFGVSAAYSWMNAKMDGYNLKSNLGFGHVYLAYSHPFFNKRLSLEAHVGAGITAMLGYQFEFDHNIKSDPQTSLNPSFMAGAAAQFFVYKRLYVEANVDFVVFFIPGDMTFGAVLPSAGVGWQF